MLSLDPLELILDERSFIAVTRAEPTSGDSEDDPGGVLVPPLALDRADRSLSIVAAADSRLA